MRSVLLAGLVLGSLAAAPAHAQIKMAVGAPITGDSAAFGAQLRAGTVQAVEDINKAGGINGQQIELSIGDDSGEPKQAVSVAGGFASAGVKFVVGHFNSGVSIPASGVYDEAGIVEITPASTNVTFTERGLWNTFRTCGRDDQQGGVAGEYLASKFAGKKVAFVHDKTPYGKGLADETLKAFRAKGGKEILVEGINPREKDYRALVSKLKQNGVDVVYFGGYYTEAGLIIKQMREQGLMAPMMGGDGMVDKQLVAIARDAAIGTLTTFPPDARKNPAAQDVVAGFKAKGVDPEAYTLYAYAAVQIFKQAIEGAGTLDGKLDGKKVAAYMREGRPFQTVLGPISFDKKGDITKPDYVIYEWRKGADGEVGYAGNELTQ